MAAAHTHDPCFFICCRIEKCSRTYYNFYSFKKHVYRKHHENLEMNVTVTNEDGTTSEYAADEDSEVESTTVDDCHHVVHNCST